MVAYSWERSDRAHDVMGCVEKLQQAHASRVASSRSGRSVGDAGAGEKLDVEESFAAKCNNTTHSRDL